MSSIESGKTQPKSFDESLVELIRRNPSLFAKETRVKPYEPITEHSEAWGNIAKSLGVEPHYCMTCWRHVRQRYRQEIEYQKQPNAAVVEFELMEKLYGFDQYSNHSSSPKSTDRKSVSSESSKKTEETFGGINYDFLPEAMESQPSTSASSSNKASPIMISTPPTSTSTTLERMKALLDGLDPMNRDKAEKRIIAYLCKCQLRALENNGLDDITI